MLQEKSLSEVLVFKLLLCSVMPFYFLAPALLVHTFDIFEPPMDENLARRVIVDTDMGLDDYWAALILLDAERSGNVKIEAITCTSGNAGVNNTCKNVVRLLEMVGRTDIPVYKGSDVDILEPRKGYYGTDGFGDLTGLIEPDMSIVQEKAADQAIADIVEQYPGEISIITLAPLTNLANAIKLRKDFKDQVKDVWIMGGNDPDNTNYQPSAEFNFNCNLDATDVVLRSLTGAVYILPWEACLDMKISLDWRYGLNHSTLITDIVTRAETKIYNRNNETEFLAADAVIAYTFLDLIENCLKTKSECLEIEMTDPIKKGQLIVYNGTDPKVILTEINVENYKTLLVKVANTF